MRGSIAKRISINKSEYRTVVFPTHSIIDNRAYSFVYHAYFSTPIFHPEHFFRVTTVEHPIICPATQEKQIGIVKQSPYMRTRYPSVQISPFDQCSRIIELRKPKFGASHLVPIWAA